ncbi:T9SS type A sorting domain-containing protein [Spirosoma validum]|uniref:T9SS type A sorting domain-containing protein n=1 Tax=Spirosoma validum TaxID=2771355 RepID=A0A927GEH9_9BACT|nr:T9SS type A sorting domain-containing protein [Spirosoma validum]MBD2754852.1 T9SS type A sorting domain-containing protein [Spirosoma validum]
MNINRFTLLVSFYLLLRLTSFAQPASDPVPSGADPAVTSRNLEPAPLAGVGSPFSMTFTIGNNGTVPISGTSVSEQMQFTICLTKSAPLTARPEESLSGSLMNYFDISWTGTCFEGRQKQDVSISAVELYELYISAVATSASSNTAVNDIGAFCNIIPNGSSNPQPTDNDFASIYTHTTTTAMPVALISFTAQAQEDRTVLLNWKTSWEHGNKGYVVERSKDLKVFEPVGEITDVASNSNTLTQYQLTDTAPYRGTSYYRLTQTDLDGRIHTYPVVSVVIRNEAYGIYPNPVRDNRFMLALDEPQSALVQMHTVSGQQVPLQAKIADDTHLELRSERSLPIGVYVLRVEERGQKRQYRLVVSE